jgi:hypothetical protein
MLVPTMNERADEGQLGNAELPSMDGPAVMGPSRSTNRRDRPGAIWCFVVAAILAVAGLFGFVSNLFEPSLGITTPAIVLVLTAVWASFGLHQRSRSQT